MDQYNIRGDGAAVAGNAIINRCMWFDVKNKRIELGRYVVKYKGLFYMPAEYRALNSCYIKNSLYICNAGGVPEMEPAVPFYNSAI